MTGYADLQAAKAGFAAGTTSREDLVAALREYGLSAANAELQASAYAGVRVLPEGEKVCGRCGGSGQYGHHGTCFDCGGRGSLVEDDAR